MRDKMLAFINGHNYCVISTVGANNKPESALVAFSVNEQELELFIGTSNKTRKFSNITSNPAVAIVIADEAGEVQYEGQATILEPEEFTDIEEQHIAKVPGGDKFRYRNDPTQRYIRITPTWARFTEHGNETDQIEEFTEFK